MNEIRVPELLLQRYNTHFLGLVHKLSRPVLGTPCCYSNNLASKPLNNNNNMHRPLKLKIQNALNQVIFADAEARGLFIGGRRRNRKKRKNRNGKEKKKQKKQDTKSSPVLVRCNSESISYIGDDRPLIESDYGSSYSLTFTDCIDRVDDLPPLIDTEYEENVTPETETMPFDFFKKSDKAKEQKKLKEKADSKEGEKPEVKENQKSEETPKEEEHKTEETVKEEEHKTEETAEEDKTEDITKEEEKEPKEVITEKEEQEQETAEKMSEEQQQAEKQTEEVKAKEEPAKTEETPSQDKAENDAKTDENPEQKKEAVGDAKEDEKIADGAPGENSKDIQMADVSKPTSNGTSGTESSPLIEKNAVKDTQPGFLCCTIL